MKYILILVLFLCSYFGEVAIAGLKSDSIPLDETTYQKERTQYIYPDFKKQSKSEPRKKSDKKGTGINPSDWIRLLRPVALGILALLSIYLLSQLSILKWLRKDTESKNQILWAQLAQMEPFDARIDELLIQALKDKDYTAAVRLRFLILLRLLNRNGSIQWAAYKTNLELSNELQFEPKKLFDEVLLPYNRIWFGKRIASELDYKHFETLCDQLAHA